MYIRNLAYLFSLGLGAAAAQSYTNRTVVGPAQLGPYPVSVSTHELRTDRDDPMAPSPEKRRLMLNIYSPQTSLKGACPHPETTPYVPLPISESFYDSNLEYIIPNGTVSRLAFTSCAAPAAGDSSDYPTTYPSPPSVPLLVFSHGARVSRFFYAALVTAVASAGYAVVSVDHTYDAAAVEFPGARTAADLVLNNYLPDDDDGASDDEEIDRYLGDFLAPLRADDAASVLDAVERGEIPGLEGYAGEGLAAGVFGHSLGGCSSALALSRDARWKGAVNFDGGVFGSVKEMVPTVPLLMMGGEYLFAADPVINETWSETFRNAQGWKRWAVVDDAAHFSFSDFSLVIDVLGLREGMAEEAIASLIGEIDSHRSLEIIQRYTIDFFDFVMKGKEPQLLAGPGQEFPEVKFVDTDDL